MGISETEEDLVVDDGAAAHPAVCAFMELCSTARGEGVLRFESLHDRAFMVHWPRLMIQRWDASHDDFLCVFFGTALVGAWGRDLTGRYLADTHGKSSHVARKIALRVLNGGETVFYSGTLGWEDRSFFKFVGVAMPMQRNGVVAEVLSWGSRA